MRPRTKVTQYKVAQLAAASKESPERERVCVFVHSVCRHRWSPTLPRQATGPRVEEEVHQ